MLALLLMAAALTGEPLVTKPEWLSKPTGRDMARAYPRRAEEQNLIGRIDLSCRITALGTLDQCAADEDPTGYDFGKAALSIAPKFKMRPVDAEGHPVAGRPIHIPILFVLPSPAALQSKFSYQGTRATLRSIAGFRPSGGLRTAKSYVPLCLHSSRSL